MTSPRHEPAGGEGAEELTSNLGQATEHVPGASRDPVVGRRAFATLIARDVAAGAGRILGMAGALRGAAIGTLLGDETEELPVGASFAALSGSAIGPPAERPPALSLDGLTGGALLDQGRLPDGIRVMRVATGADLALAVRERAIERGGLLGPLAAAALAGTAAGLAMQPGVSMAQRLRPTARMLRRSVPASAALEHAVLVALDTADASDDPMRVSADLQSLGRRLFQELSEATDAVACEVGALLAVDEMPGDILVLGGGWTHGGAHGPVVGAVALLAGSRRRILVAELSPGREGARLIAPELAALGVAHALISDASAGAIVAGGRVRAVLAPAERIDEGGVVSMPGSYAAAVLAGLHHVPFVVLAHASAETTGAAAGLDDPVAHELVAGRPGRGLPPPVDRIPLDLVSAIVTEHGVRALDR